MREKKTKPHSVIFSSILLFVAISPLFIHAINTNYTIESNATPVSVEKPKISDYWNLEYIRIDNNWSHTAGNYTWCFKENGFYVIENVTIDATGAPNNIGLEIRNSNEYFIIRNCTILNSGNIGISLDDVNNGTLNNNTFESNYRGIWINNGSNNTITDCKIIGSGGTGIALSLSTNNTIESNTINCVGSYQGIYLQSSSHNNTISKNTVTGATQADPDWGVGIAIQSSDICIISHNSIKNNKFGIKLRNGADNNSVKSNSIESNSQYGLMLTSTVDNNMVYK